MRPLQPYKAKAMRHQRHIAFAIFSINFSANLIRLQPMEMAQCKRELRVLGRAYRYPYHRCQ